MRTPVQWPRAPVPTMPQNEAPPVSQASSQCQTLGNLLFEYSKARQHLVEFLTKHPNVAEAISDLQIDI